jgi:hypothetical protein
MHHKVPTTELFRPTGSQIDIPLRPEGYNSPEHAAALHRLSCDDWAIIVETFEPCGERFRRLPGARGRNYVARGLPLADAITFCEGIERPDWLIWGYAIPSRHTPFEGVSPALPYVYSIIGRDWLATSQHDVMPGPRDERHPAAKIFSAQIAAGRKVTVIDDRGLGTFGGAA